MVPEYQTLNGDTVRISKYKNIYAKCYTSNWSEGVLWLKMLRVCATDRCGEEIVGTFYKNELEKTNQKEFRNAEVIMRKGDKL